MTRATASANSRQDGAPSDPASGNGATTNPIPVSYTHLTLPTKA